MKRAMATLAMAFGLGACNQQGEEQTGEVAPALTTQVVSQQQPSAQQRTGKLPVLIERAAVTDENETEDATASVTSTATDAVPLPNVEADCEGAACGVADDGSYAGSGVGVWSYHNDGESAVELEVSIPGTSGKSVMLVFSNLASDSVAMPEVSAAFNLTGTGPAASQSNPAPRVRHFKPRVQIDTPFQKGLPVRERRDFELPAAPPLHSVVGDFRNFYHEDDSLRATTLRKQVTAADGRVVNFWVENTEYGTGMVLATHVDQIAAAFASGADSIYTAVTGFAGQPWGAHPYANLIDANQDIDVVILNFEDDATPYGLLGYFWARNAFKTSAEPKSNASLSFYLDSETIYLVSDGSGLKEIVSTLAHEFMHMINFYQRGILMASGDHTFDTWLEEMTATMVEDVVGLKLDASFHPIRDGRYSDWLAMGDFNCDPTSEASFSGATPVCFGYSVAGAFGGHLMRHFGLSFLSSLLQADSSTDSAALLDDVLRDNGATLAGEIRRWGASLALFPATASPDGFGYPERTFDSFTLPAFDGGDFAGIRSLPGTVPSALVHFGHFPVLRPSPGATFEEVVSIEAGMALTVVVK